MYAEIPQEAVEAKEYLFYVGKIYDIKKFRVNNAKPTYKPFDAILMIEITEFTTVELTTNPPATIPEYIYSLTPFSAIVPASGPVSKYTGLHLAPRLVYHRNNAFNYLCSNLASLISSSVQLTYNRCSWLHHQIYGTNHLCAQKQGESYHT